MRQNGCRKRRSHVPEQDEAVLVSAHLIDSAASPVPKASTSMDHGVGMVDVCGSILARMRESPSNLRYDELYQVCVEHFGLPRTRGSSHAVFRVPWPDDPRVNIQEGKDSGCKIYQVKQVLAAIDRLQKMRTAEATDNG